MPPIPAVPTTPEEAADFLRWCVTHIGGGFHIDTSGCEYTNRQTGERTFPDNAEADRLDEGLDACCQLLDDPYVLTLDLLIREDG